MAAESWFILEDGQVRGPLDRDGVRAAIRSPDSSLIWGVGMPYWMNLPNWADWVEKIDAQKKVEKLKLARRWKIKYQQEKIENLLYQEMLELIKTRQLPIGDVFVYTDGYSDFVSLLKVHRIMDDLGVGRRKFPRVSIQGYLTISYPPELASSKLRVNSLSEGGLGFWQGNQFKVGDVLVAELSSADLPSRVSLTGEVVYVDLNGSTGLKFTEMSSEHKHIVLTYIRKNTLPSAG